MALLAVKLLLAPAFVTAASLVARRFGVTIGGVIAGLPVVAGPILLVYELQHGRAFAAQAAAGTLLGLISLAAFVAVYGRMAAAAPWAPCVLGGWLAFAAGTLALDHVAPGRWVGLAGAIASFGVAAAVLPRGAERLAGGAHPAWDLPARAVCAAALVLCLTAVSGRLGPHLSGLLAPFPILTAVLATFTHGHQGEQAALALLRGMLRGFTAFALFCAVLALTLDTLPAGASFALATAAALACQSAALALTRRPAAGYVRA